jgi:hypothetical protein
MTGTSHAPPVAAKDVPHILQVIPLREALEQIDGTLKGDNLTGIIVGAAKVVKMTEHGWRVGKITLLGRLPVSDGLEIIRPSNSLKPALDRFGGHDFSTPTIRIDRGGHHEVWGDIAIDDAGLDWLKRVNLTDLKRELPESRSETQIVYAAEHNAEEETRDWLAAMMLQGPVQKQIHVAEEAKHRFGITVRGFRRAWSAAIAATGAEHWRKPGPKGPHAIRRRCPRRCEIPNVE